MNKRKLHMKEDKQEKVKMEDDEQEKVKVSKELIQLKEND